MDSKPWYESKTIQSAGLFLVIIIALLLAGREFVAEHPVMVLLLAAAREVFATVLRFITSGEVHVRE